MTVWTWAVRDRYVVGVSDVPEVDVTAFELEWGPAAFPWGLPAFPSLLIYSIGIDASTGVRFVNPLLTWLTPDLGAVDLILQNAALPSFSAAGSRIEYGIDRTAQATPYTLSGFANLVLAGGPLPAAIVMQPGQVQGSRLTIETANPFQADALGAATIIGTLLPG